MRIKELIKKFIPNFLLNFYHYNLALLGAFLYGFPSNKLTVIGVTGTSGKSTVVELTTKILEDAGLKVASLSSIKFKIDKKEWENRLKMTMPGRFKIQRFLKQAVRAGCKYAVLEVTSEGIKQYRHKFIDFDVAVFTNLSPEHIESHGSFERYRGAKLKLFKTCRKVHIINLDDKNAEYFWKISAEKKIGYSTKISNFQFPISNKFPISNFQRIFAEDVQFSTAGISFSINNLRFNLNLFGSFNIYNVLGAICVGLSQGISLEVCKKVLEKVKGIPGRMEIVVKKPFVVIVDYAHTPQSLKKVYETLRNPKTQPSKLICVLGSCGGGRDKWKRPILGKIAAKYCKEVIVTNEDPYDEKPMEIIKQVAQGTGDKVRKILDRRKAIRWALKLARPDDVVVITGKGSEPWMCLANGRKIPWDDRQIVREELKDLPF